MRFLHSLQWRIVLAYTALIVISMGLVGLYLIGFVCSTYISNLEERLEQEAGLVGEIPAYYFQSHIDPGDLAAASTRNAMSSWRRRAIRREEAAPMQ